MKKWIWAALICLAAVFAALWVGSRPPKADTNLEFWIAEHVDDVDFSGYQEKYGLMGGREYYGRGYTPLTGSNGEQIDPEECVIYTVTSYPDYASNRRHVTRIAITDPAVELYGVTLHSSPEEIDAAMKQHGFRAQRHPNVNGQVYSRGKFTFRFSSDAICLHAEVRNLWGIQF